MKKQIVNYAIAAAIMMPGLWACTNDELVSPTGDGEESTVYFTAQLPAQIASRDFGNGKTATNLTYAVYESGSETPIITSIDEISFTGGSLSTTVSLKLVNGKTYDIIFWADAPGAPYTFDAESQTVTIDYENTAVASNAEDRDAFFAAEKGLKVTGPINKEILLYRPFAQVNFGTDDLDEQAFAQYKDGIKTTLSTKAYTTLNLLTGEASGQVDVTYGLAGLPGDSESFPVTGYDYLSMNYLLVGESQELVDMEFTINDGTEDLPTIKINSVPVQRNYRTNIYGSLLTSAANLTVEIKPGFNGSENVEIWDGTTGTLPDEDADGVITISTPAQLAAVAAAVNNGTTRFEGKTIKLAADLNLGNQAWTPIGDLSIAAYPSGAFAGTFDGGNHVISNLNASSAISQHAAAGLFGTITGKILNLTVKDAVVNSTHYAGVIAAYSSTNGAKISNCHVENATVVTTPELVSGAYDNGDKAGGIIGYCVESDEVTGCSVKNATIQGYRDLGSIVGCCNGATVTDCTAADVVINQDFTNGYKTLSQVINTVDEMTGGVMSKDNVSGCSFENVTINQNLVPGADKGIADLLAEAKVAGMTTVTISLAAGETALPTLGNSAYPENIVFVGAGADETKLGFQEDLYADNKNVTFKDLDLVMPGDNYSGFKHAKNVEFVDSKITGLYFTYGSESEKFVNTTFVQDKVDYNIWVYGSISATISFDGCTFECAGKSVLAYNEGGNNLKVYFKDCTLTASSPAHDGKAAIEINTEYSNVSYEIHIDNTTATGFDNGSVSGISLWNEKRGDKATVYVDGQLVKSPSSNG